MSILCLLSLNVPAAVHSWGQAGHWQGCEHLSHPWLKPLWLCLRSRDEINAELEKRRFELWGKRREAVVPKK